MTGREHAQRRDRAARRIAAGIAGLLTGCEGPQSSLEPAGRDAAQMAELYWLMAIGSVVIWALVTALALHALYAREPKDERTVDRLVVIGGAVLPTILLAALLVYGLAMLPGVLARAPEGSPEIHVVGEQYWWRVRYADRDGGAVETANELHLPVDTPVELRLEASDVIHSFWIPSLAGKMDMIPGRVTRLRLEPTRTGTFRGACAEYCGTSHAWMAFTVVVEPREDFERWLSAQARPAAQPSNDRAAHGAALFLSQGCGACHAVRGTPADGTIGPDLTHVGGRRTIGAGRVATSASALRRWVADPDALKPGVHMPAFAMLQDGELAALAAYLEGLR